MDDLLHCEKTTERVTEEAVSYADQFGGCTRAINVYQQSIIAVEWVDMKHSLSTTRRVVFNLPLARSAPWRGLGRVEFAGSRRNRQVSVRVAPLALKETTVVLLASFWTSLVRARILHTLHVSVGLAWPPRHPLRPGRDRHTQNRWPWNQDAGSEWNGMPSLHCAWKRPISTRAQQ